MIKMEKYLKKCEKCNIEFTFNKNDIKKKNIIEHEFTDSCTVKLYEAQEDFTINKGTVHKILTTETTYDKIKVTYKYLKCPVCSYHNIIIRIKSEFIEKCIEKEKERHF